MTSILATGQPGIPAGFGCRLAEHRPDHPGMRHVLPSERIVCP